MKTSSNEGERKAKTDTYPPVHLHLLCLLLFHGRHGRCLLNHRCSSVRGLIGQMRWVRNVPCRGAASLTPPSSWTSNNTNSPPSLSFITPRFLHLFRAFVIPDSSTPPPTLDIKASTVHISEKHPQNSERSLKTELKTYLSPQRDRSQQPQAA